MRRYKYKVWGQADYTKAILGDFKDIIPDIGIGSDKVAFATLTCDKILDDKEREKIRSTYEDGLKDIRVGVGGRLRIVALTYDGFIEVDDKELIQVNIFEGINNGTARRQTNGGKSMGEDFGLFGGK